MLARDDHYNLSMSTKDSSSSGHIIGLQITLHCPYIMICGVNLSCVKYMVGVKSVELGNVWRFKFFFFHYGFFAHRAKIIKIYKLKYCLP